ncbi:HlyD family secretion protein [Legionella longbeachae]|uniref:Putative coiled-coil protein n=3 Tax=Legionella longbeachae TaxID=450 RepID=D3HPD0_LEGLN|nr:HlyD family efflux transporter periplasmic adaptor subunit [Legionella longbeachae]HBD7398294.1 HlyD family efflux transporter periplasmic adaptor subunit [Legionella pneumophila]ARB92364.1 hypothetical protein A6J40_09335 [Legionella longbeachae]ARM34454.1 HlyD family efflux transporter periplasmic adaptor subunit [Legionella longbeachae]QIN31215.1 HlyD family efflux transporter periplasmic adaptor subunit [Legionella longbeachae]RZV24182.1 HlyD family efflux transporter periplasmic adapto
MGIKWKKNTTPTGLAVKYGSGSRMTPKLRWVLLVLLLSIPLLYLFYELFTEYVLIRFPGLIVYDTVTIRAPENGYIKKLSARTGEKIIANQKLLQFASPLVEEKLAYLQVEKKRIIELMNSLVENNSQQISQALNISQQDIETSKLVYERFKNYSKNGDLIELQLEEARKNYITAVRSYVELSQKIEELSLQRATLIEVNFKRKILEIDNEVEQIKTKMRYFALRSPDNGTIMNISTHQDEFVSAGQNLMSIVTDKNLRIVAFIEPKYAEDIYQGKKINIIFPDNEEISGFIVNTPSYAEKTPLSEINPLATRENKLLAIIKPNKVIQKKYAVFGMPVKIKLE